MIRIVLAGWTLIATGSVVLAEAENAAGYKCIIKQSLSLGKDGSTLPSASAAVFRNKEFIVDRASGRTLGDTINSQGWHKIEVWDRGSSQQSYKSFYSHSGGADRPIPYFNLLQIEEFSDGDAKPFLLIQGTIMHTGFCTHLR
jgi:hypothetical protein